MIQETNVQRLAVFVRVEYQLGGFSRFFFAKITFGKLKITFCYNLFTVFWILGSIYFCLQLLLAGSRVHCKIDRSRDGCNVASKLAL